MMMLLIIVAIEKSPTRSERHTQDHNVTRLHSNTTPLFTTLNKFSRTYTLHNTIPGTFSESHKPHSRYSLNET